ncbi:MAG: AAA family ATPase [bacterium]|nr:AAA family ATPase [bacterium]
MIGEKRLIHKLKLHNILSFGDPPVEIELKSLNVLIGPNGSGKSNLIEVINFLRAAPKDLAAPIREGGGIAEWIWKGNGNPKDPSQRESAEIESLILYPAFRDEIRLLHRIKFDELIKLFWLNSELIENADTYLKNENNRFFYFLKDVFLNSASNKPLETASLFNKTEGEMREIETPFSQSVLSQIKDSTAYPEITFLGNQYSRFKIYRDWDFGPNSLSRLPQRVDLPGDFLEENYSNLCLILNRLEHKSLKKEIVQKLKEFHESIEDLTIHIEGPTVQVFLHEKGLRLPISAYRLSNGTLKYLSLLAILCHPEPPPLICIEEPETGLHPDILPIVADLLIEASHRTQLIVTTHSDILVDALTKVPEAVMICEKHEGSTTMKRLSSCDLKEWLKKYSLGELWRSGELGGNRW